MHGLNATSSGDADRVATGVADGQYVTFSCGETAYAVPIMAVREIRSWQPTTPLPGRVGAARGVLDIRGTVVEVFDLAALLGGSPIKPSTASVVLVLALETKIVGILVDAVSDIIQSRPGDLMPVPAQNVDGLWTGQVGAMISQEERLIAILDLDRVFPRPVLAEAAPDLIGNLPSDGGAERDRTADLIIANDALSQLSYSPIRSARTT